MDILKSAKKRKYKQPAQQVDFKNKTWKMFWHEITEISELQESNWKHAAVQVWHQFLHLHSCQLYSNLSDVLYRVLLLHGKVVCATLNLKSQPSSSCILNICSARVSGKQDAYIDSAVCSTSFTTLLNRPSVWCNTHQTNQLVKAMRHNSHLLFFYLIFK